MKQCIYCRTTLVDEAAFCHTCGKTQPPASEVGAPARQAPAQAAYPMPGTGVQPVSSSPSSTPSFVASAVPVAPVMQKKKKVALLLVAGGILAVIIVVCCLFLFSSGFAGGLVGDAGNIAYYFNRDSPDGDFIVVTEGGGTLNFGSNVDYVESSLDNSLWYTYEYLKEPSEDVEDYRRRLRNVTLFNGLGRELLYVPEVCNVIFDRATNIVYYQRLGRRGGLYRFRNGKEEQLLDSVDYYVPSTNGEHILYTYDRELFYMSLGKQPEKLADVEEGTQPVAISNDGNYRYYSVLSQENTENDVISEVFCLTAAGETDFFTTSSTDDNTRMVFDDNSGRLAFFSSDGCWLYVDGKFEKIYDEDGFIVPVDSSEAGMYNAYCSYISGQTLTDFFFRNFIDTTVGTTAYLHYTGGEVIELVRDDNGLDSLPFLSDDLNTLIYITSDDDLYRLNIASGEETLLAIDVSSWETFADEDTLYYKWLDNNDDYISELFYREGTGEAVMLGEQVRSCIVSDNLEYCAFLDYYDEEDGEGELMLSHNGGEPVSLGMAGGLVHVGDDGMVLFSSDSETYKDSNGDYQRTFRLWVYDGGKATVLEKNAYN